MAEDAPTEPKPPELQPESPYSEAAELRLVDYLRRRLSGDLPEMDSQHDAQPGKSE